MRILVCRMSAVYWVLVDGTGRTGCARKIPSVVMTTTRGRRPRGAYQLPTATQARDIRTTYIHLSSFSSLPKNWVHWYRKDLGTPRTEPWTNDQEFTVLLLLLLLMLLLPTSSDADPPRSCAWPWHTGTLILDWPWVSLGWSGYRISLSLMGNTIRSKEEMYRSCRNTTLTPFFSQVRKISSLQDWPFQHSIVTPCVAMCS